MFKAKVEGGLVKAVCMVSPMASRADSLVPDSAPERFTNTAQLPINIVKNLIAAVAERPNLWLRVQKGQKRSDINRLWCEVSEQVQLPVEICRIKWGHLRDNFRKVYIRNTSSMDTPTTWRFYNDMRFMENAVAENIMHQNRLKSQSYYTLDMQQSQFPQSHTDDRLFSDVTTHEYCDPKLKEPDFSMCFLNTYPHKRIKVEPQNSERTFDREESSDEMIFHGLNEHDAVSPSNNIQTEGARKPIDEDSKNSGRDLFEKEQYIADEQHRTTAISDLPPHLNPGYLNNFGKKVKGCDLHFENADRMFLLSLLPYLEKVDESRKLHVRQKLQDVFIKEFG